MTALLPAGPFSVLYADPPWSYYAGMTDPSRRIENQYPTMQPDEIAALPVADVAAADAVLFCWATGPKLPVALHVMAAWGFEYKTFGFCWVKRNRGGRGWFAGMGRFTRANAELCLVGTRGRPVPRLDRSVIQVVDAPVTAHSRKPEAVRDRIEALYGDVPRLELFARASAPGWTSWGNQVQAPPVDLLGDPA